MSEQSKTTWLAVVGALLRPLLGPALLLGAGALVIFGLGAAQRLGWISAGEPGEGDHEHAAAEGEEVLYICPMMCTPPQLEPGRCPVCGMKLEVSTAGGGTGDERSIQIDPASRRVANIRTAKVQSEAVSRKIRAVGQISYDEGRLKTLAAYVDGRLDRLYADYTGVVVNRGDHLALLYSPELYTAQTELLSAKRAAERTQSSLYSGALDTADLQQSVRRKLIDLGMTEPQIAKLERTGQPVTRIELAAPIHGTVIDKLASEGDYVKTGQPIYRLADLSSVWLMLELFPEDAAAIRYGQRVTARVQSLPGTEFVGRVAFVDPTVDVKTRTIGVRVVIANPQRRLKVGDYATATVSVPIADPSASQTELYDPELAGKWISPRHPHVIEEAPGKCRRCGIELVPASTFGFVDYPPTGGEQLVVPRGAVLMAGDNSVVYVEVEEGRFQIRRVELGPSLGDRIVLLGGVRKGELVATNGNFLIDSQMQLAGNPSLIDPTRAGPILSPDEAASPEVIAALAELSEADRAAAQKQRICPVTEALLGSMGIPPKVDLAGRTVFICCEGCRKTLLDDPQKYLAKLDEAAAEPSAAEPTGDGGPQIDLPPIGPIEIIGPTTELPTLEPPPAMEPPAMELPMSGGTTDQGEDDEIAAALARLSPADRALARKQKNCPVADMPLGSMGTPIKVDVGGTPVFICCEGCRETLLENPAEYLDKLRRGAGE